MQVSRLYKSHDTSVLPTPFLKPHSFHSLYNYSFSKHRLGMKQRYTTYGLSRISGIDGKFEKYFTQQTVYKSRPQNKRKTESIRKKKERLDSNAGRENRTLIPLTERVRLGLDGGCAGTLSARRLGRHLH